MTQTERRTFLIQRLLAEQPRYKGIVIPQSRTEQSALLRSLMNVRGPEKIGGDFLSVQDDYLREETAQKGITDLAELIPISDGLYLWQGDITTLRCDAIVNAANSGMTGCYVPCHRCIDNCIHTYAGVQLRLECARLMAEQGHKEETGRAKITPAYNLPCKYILHTVGPIIDGNLRKSDCSCLELAEQNGVESIAFCCISTGEFHFPNDRAAEISVNTVREYLDKAQMRMNVIFNVFKDVDYQIYWKLLKADQ